MDDRAAEAAGHQADPSYLNNDPGLYRDPYRNLWLKVVEMAFVDLERCRAGKVPSGIPWGHVQRVSQALDLEIINLYRYFFSNDYHVGSLLWVADHCFPNPDRMVENLRRLVLDSAPRRGRQDRPPHI